MNIKSNKRKIILLILSVLIITLLSSCNKKEAETTLEESTTITTPQTIQPKEAAVEETTVVKEEEEEVFDESELGYTVKDDQLFLNDRALPAGKIATTKKEADRTTYQFYDGAALIIKSNGDLIVDFPIRITLLIDKDFTTFKTLYKGNPLTNATIYDFITADNWYTIDYGDNTTLNFDNSTLIFSTNNLEIKQDQNSSETIFKDIIISTSNIKTTDALTSIIKIEYEDGNQLTHIIGGSTTFIFKSGTSIESDGNTTTISKDNETTVVTGEIKGINFNEETGEIFLETTEESVKFDTTGEIIEKKSLVSPPVEETIEDNQEDLIEDSSLVANEESESAETIEQPTEVIENEQLSQDSIENEGPQSFEQETIGEWDLEEIVNPYRIGATANFTFLQVSDMNSDYGLKGEFIIENEVVDGTVIGLQIGFGADHFSTSGSLESGFYKEISTLATFSQEFTPAHSKTAYFYKIGIGSLIPFSEGDSETPYFKVALSAGVNFNIDANWLLRLSGEFAINYRTEIVTSEAASIGLFYKFK